MWSPASSCRRQGLACTPLLPAIGTTPLMAAGLCDGRTKPCTASQPCLAWRCDNCSGILYVQQGWISSSRAASAAAGLRQQQQGWISRQAAAGLRQQQQGWISRQGPQLKGAGVVRFILSQLSMPPSKPSSLPSMHLPSIFQLMWIAVFVEIDTKGTWWCCSCCNAVCAVGCRHEYA